MPQSLCMTRPLKSVAELRVESLDLMSSSFGFFGSSFGAGGELSRSHGGDKESEERDPVVGCSDGEGAEGRQEEEIETEHRDDRCQERRQAAPASCDEQHIQQQRERHGSRVDMRADYL